MSGRPLALLVACSVALAACGDKKDDTAPAQTQSRAPLKGNAADPQASTVVAALNRVPAAGQADRRLAFVDLARIDEVDAGLTQHVLGKAAPQNAQTAVRVGDRLVGHSADLGPGAKSVLSGQGGPVMAQLCLGDAISETILGPDVVGHNSAIGAAVRPTHNGGHSLVVCAAPDLHRDLDATMQRLEQAFPKAQVEEIELLERDMVTAVIDVKAVEPSVVTALVSGGEQLRRFAGR